jgi:hypothetical protein
MAPSHAFLQSTKLAIDNPTVWRQGCRADATELYVQHTWRGLALSWNSTTSHIFLLYDPDEREHSDFLSVSAQRSEFATVA